MCHQRRGGSQPQRRARGSRGGGTGTGECDTSLNVRDSAGTTARSGTLKKGRHVQILEKGGRMA